jgi:hypothetical protein
MGSMREALKAGCKLATIDTPITMAQAIVTCLTSIVGSKINPVAWPKSNENFQR